MSLFRNRYRNETTRLQTWDYASDGRYFITICTHNRKHSLGQIKQGMVQLSHFGKITEQCWYDLPNHYYNLILDAFIVMPDHIHGIMIIDNSRYGDIVGAGLKPAPTISPVPTISPYPARQHGLFEFVRAFKTFSSRRMNELDNTPGKTRWQSRFYDHIIRDEQEFQRIQQYIQNNPFAWEKEL